MTMEVETLDPAVADSAETTGRDQIIDHLTNKDEICFKSQQLGEADLSKSQKADIALDIYNKSKLTFLVRFGKYLQKNHLEFFDQFTQNCNESYEISLVLKDYLETCKTGIQINVKNRRFEALKEMIDQGAYFSEIEMMKRNPLLYEQLVGQYLTEEEKMERDRSGIDESATLVKVLMEGIERDDAKLKKKEQEDYEDGAMEEEEDSDEDEPTTPQPSYSQWGEFAEDTKPKVYEKEKIQSISVQEQILLKEEFITSMYQSFLDGKDEDFDYESVDNNDKYDNMEMKECDAEDKYFDSEEPETVNMEAEPEESEDELDIFMSALDQNPAVNRLTKDMKKL